MERIRCAMKRAVAFTLIELLIVIVIIAIIGGLLLPVLNRAKRNVKDLECMNNLKQWGLATHLYAIDNDDYLPPEGPPTPGPKLPSVGWYLALPRLIGYPEYHHMPWRTNVALTPGHSLFICPSNPRRATNNNLFHYCLNQHIDGTGPQDRPVRLHSVPFPAVVVQLFDNGKRAAVAQQNNVHTNLHHEGAQFLFLDGHTRRFPNPFYWDFAQNRGRTDQARMRWKP